MNCVNGGPFPMQWCQSDWEKPGYRDGQMTSLKLFSFERPHMRSFVSLVCPFMRMLMCAAVN